MKFSILIPYLIVLIFFSCQNQANKHDVENEKVKVQLKGIDNHPNKAHMEWLLNNYEEEFIASEVNLKTLEHDNLIQIGYNFHTKLSNVSLILIFCKNQQDAVTIAYANFPVVEGVQSTGVNGGVLFVVQGNDQNKVDDVLGWFAGEE